MTRGGAYFENCSLWVYLFWSCAIGLLACWPILVMGSVFVFFDSHSYLSNGAAISDVLSGMLERQAGEAVEGSDVAERGRSIRSIVYSAFAYFGSLTWFGAAVPMVVQSALVSAVALLLVPAQVLQRTSLAILALLVVLLATPWPFYASLFMPDLLTAAVILGAMVMVRGTNRRGCWAVGLVVAFAASSHYGNFPLALALMGAVAFLLLVQRRLTWAAVLTMSLPLVAAFLVNVLGSLVAFDEPSVAPRRLPILLARSLADGPARWHLEQNCDVYKYEICTAIETLPDNVGAALWGEGGLSKIRSVAVMDRIRAQETILLWRAFLEYPKEQSWSLIRNAALQMVRFGLSDVYSGGVQINADGSYLVTQDKDRHRLLFERLEWVHIVVVLLSLALVIDGVVRRRIAIMPVVGVMFLGFVFNAAIFGGLSAPVDRYQGRIIWILPMLAALILLSRQSTDADS